MSILVNESTRLVVQGMTGREGSFHTERCIQFGTKVVGGVTPGRGGTEHLGLPVFDSVRDAVEKAQANASLVFVPAAFATDAVLEAAEGGVKLVVCITDGIPTLDMVVISDFLRKRGVRMIGPNCPGVTSPGAKAKVGIIPGNIHLPGRVGVVSRSGTLTYEAVAQLTNLGIGQSTCVGIGGDPIVGSRFRDILELFEADPETDAVVLIGEIGGTAEQEAAEFIKGMKKPVTAFIAGATAPPGRRMGHAGAIITGEAATAAAKKKALADAGAFIAESPAAIGITAQRMLQAKGAAGRR